MRIVILKTNRTYYDATECANDGTMTVSELINELENYPSDAKVMFSNDNGYTYGYIYERTIEEI